MSFVSFQEYLTHLNSELSKQNSLIETIERVLLEMGITFELKKKEIQSTASSKLSDYNPKGLDLEIPKVKNLDLSKKEIENFLNEIFNLKK